MNRHKFEIDMKEKGSSSTITMDGIRLDGVAGFAIDPVRPKTPTKINVELFSTAVISAIGKLSLTTRYANDELGDLMLRAVLDANGNDGPLSHADTEALKAVAVRFLELVVEESGSDGSDTYVNVRGEKKDFSGRNVHVDMGDK